MLGNLATENHCNLVRLSDGSIGVEQTLSELVQGRAATEDEVVAELDLREEQPVSTACLFSLSCREERGEVCEPLLAAGHQISRSERVGELLQALGRCAFQEDVAALLDCDAVLAHAVG